MGDIGGTYLTWKKLCFREMLPIVSMPPLKEAKWSPKQGRLNGYELLPTKTSNISRRMSANDINDIFAGVYQYSWHAAVSLPLAVHRNKDSGVAIQHHGFEQQ